MSLNHKTGAAPRTSPASPKFVRPVLVITTLVVGLSVVRLAQAYEASFVHPWLTREAVLHLQRAHPGQYPALQEFLPPLIAGAEHEDDLFLDNDRDPLTARSGRHFYRPTDRAGLTLGETPYTSSYKWGAEANFGNQWDWYDALESYRAGDHIEAYYALGHVVHLVQDLTVPAHVHLDVHGPPTGDDYENYTWFQTTSPVASSLPRPMVGAPIPVFDDLDAVWQRTATATFWRSMVSGDLANTEQPRGDIVEMFPEIQWSWFSEQWAIEAPPVGALGVDFFEELPGWFYFKDTEQTAVMIQTGFDADRPMQLTLSPNTSGQHMAQALAQDLVPLAIVTSAAVIALFERDAALLEPLPPQPDVPVPQAPQAGCRAAPTPYSALVFAGWLLAWRRRHS